MSTQVIINAATTAPISGEVDLDFYAGYDKNTFTVEIYGTATTATVTFKAKAASGVARDITGVRISDFSTGTSGGMNEIWQFDGGGLSDFVATVTAVTGGNVTVAGKW